MSLKLAAPVVFLFLWTSAKGKDAEVVCVLGQSCLLPCSFHTGPDVIHWIKEPHEETPVHSFYDRQSQFKHQHKNYTNRTSLFETEVDSGNASLLLRTVNVEDEGRYKCYISHQDKKESFVNLRVHAPVLELWLQLQCRAENIYPRPRVNWTSSPEPPPEPQESIQPQESGLFSVRSSVNLTQRPPLEHSCNISTAHSWRSATYRRNTPINSTGSEVTLRCAPNSTSSIKALNWTFNNQLIVSQTGSKPVYSGSWEQSVELSDSGDLRLKEAKHFGNYSCHLHTDTGSYISHTEVEGTRAQERQSPADNTTWIIVGCICGVLVFIIVGGILCWKRDNIKERCSSQRNRSPAPPQAEQLHLNPPPPEQQRGPATSEEE